jgi:ABC-type polysaccharide/polyol phosphate export permease
VDNSNLIKRVPVPREVIPISAVLSCAIHLLIQMAFLLALVMAFGSGINLKWLWLPVVLFLEVLFVMGISLLTAGLNVFSRDTRYVVESINTVMFWLVPIFYSISLVPPQYLEAYNLNPLAALTVALRNILLQGTPPAWTLLTKMAMVSVGSLAAGWFAFRRLKPHFYNYL